jgi:hypothetical protein
MPLVIIALMLAVVLPGCNEELPPVEADELVIPSSLSPQEVVEGIFPENPMRFILGNYFHAAWQGAKGTCEEGFVGGYGEPFYGTATPLLIFVVLKYESTEFAQRSYHGIGEAHGLHNLTYRNIALKIATQPASEYGSEELWGVSNLSFYVIESGCFIIFFYGHDDIAADALDRIIVAFGVKE